MTNNSSDSIEDDLLSMLEQEQANQQISSENGEAFDSADNLAGFMEESEDDGENKKKKSKSKKKKKKKKGETSPEEDLLNSLEGIEEKTEKKSLFARIMDFMTASEDDEEEIEAIPENAGFEDVQGENKEILENLDSQEDDGKKKKGKKDKKAKGKDKKGEAKEGASEEGGDEEGDSSDKKKKPKKEKKEKKEKFKIKS